MGLSGVRSQQVAAVYDRWQVETGGNLAEFFVRTGNNYVELTDTLDSEQVTGESNVTGIRSFLSNRCESFNR